MVVIAAFSILAGLTVWLAVRFDSSLLMGLPFVAALRRLLFPLGAALPGVRFATRISPRDDGGNDSVSAALALRVLPD